MAGLRAASTNTSATSALFTVPPIVSPWFSSMPMQTKQSKNRKPTQSKNRHTTKGTQTSHISHLETAGKYRGDLFCGVWGGGNKKKKRKHTQAQAQARPATEARKRHISTHNRLTALQHRRRRHCCPCLQLDTPLYIRELVLAAPVTVTQDNRHV